MLYNTIFRNKLLYEQFVYDLLMLKSYKAFLLMHKFLETIMLFNYKFIVWGINCSIFRYSSMISCNYCVYSTLYSSIIFQYTVYNIYELFYAWLQLNHIKIPFMHLCYRRFTINNFSKRICSWIVSCKKQNPPAVAIVSRRRFVREDIS